MRKENPLKSKIRALKKNSAPIFVSSFAERNQAHNVAGRLGIAIKTQKRLDGSGFEICRRK